MYRRPASNTKKMSCMLASGLFQEPAGPRAERMSQGISCYLAALGIVSPPNLLSFSLPRPIELLSWSSKEVVIQLQHIQQCRSNTRGRLLTGNKSYSKAQGEPQSGYLQVLQYQTTARKFGVNQVLRWLCSSTSWPESSPTRKQLVILQSSSGTAKLPSK